MSTTDYGSPEWLAHELHVIDVKMFFGILHRPEDSYKWPELVEVAQIYGVSLDSFRLHHRVP